MFIGAGRVNKHREHGCRAVPRPFVDRDGTRHTRRAFTLIEMLLAMIVTSLVATAGTTMIFAVTDASTQSRSVREEKTAGQYALARIARTVRQARAIGSLTSTAITLWLADANGDDVINVGEIGFISYNPGNRKILFATLRPSQSVIAPLPVSLDQFTTPALLLVIYPNSARKEVEWASKVETCVFTGYPSQVEAKIVGVHLTIRAGKNDVAFQINGSPRASGDYLFFNNAQVPPNGPAGRNLRGFASPWDGIGTLPTMTLTPQLLQL